MQHTFGKLLDMERLRAVPAPQIDSDGDNEDWGDPAHDDVSIYRRTLNVVIRDRIGAGERPLRPTERDWQATA